MHEELRTHKHVTLRLLWQEYRRDHPDGYGYSYFCQHYRAWEGRIDVVMRQHHRAGEKLFVDWAGDTLPYVDPRDRRGQRGPSLPRCAGLLELHLRRASTQTSARRASSTPTCSAFEHFGGVPELLVPDNLKTGVKRPDRYEAEIAAPYAELAAHYGAVVLPARAGKPRDKAKVEVGVQIAEREILAPLRHRTFFSLAEINAAIAERLEAVNARPFAKLPGSRASIFAEREAPLLRALPAEPLRPPHAQARRGAHRLPRRARLATTTRCPTTSCASASSCASMRARVEVYHEGVRVAPARAQPRARARATTADRAHAGKAPARRLLDA